MIRARLKHRGRDYSLGQYITKKEVEAAKESARRVFEAIDAKQRSGTTPPGAEVVLKLVSRGIFDAQPSLMLSLAEALVRRQRMLAHRQRRTLYPRLSDDDRRNLAARVAPKNSIR